MPMPPVCLPFSKGLGTEVVQYGSRKKCVGLVSMASTHGCMKSYVPALPASLLSRKVLPFVSKVDTPR